jgi:S-adenosylmethionine-diacylglycerol 3-amino-3-carboxypropyl transferase
VGRAPSFHEIRYAQVWEDPRVLRRGLELRAGEVALSIGAAGDNALALLLDDPAEVWAVDFSPAQVALFELKRAALARLEAEELHAFFGVDAKAVPAARRLTLWREKLRDALGVEARAFFEAREQAIAAGLLGSGRFERYFAIFRRFVLPLVQAQSDVRRFLAAGSLAEQRALFRSRWDNRRWRALFRLFFGETLLGRLGRDPSFFAFVEEGDVGGAFLKRAERALCDLPVSDNYFIEWILTGRYSGRLGLPPWLEPENLPTLRARLSRIRLVRSSLEDALAREDAPLFSAFNLSDIFEWMSPADTLHTFRLVLSKSAPGARLVYWNLLVPRRRPDELEAELVPDEEKAAALHAIDRAFFYRDVVVERVPGPSSP